MSDMSERSTPQPTAAKPAETVAPNNEHCIDSQQLMSPDGQCWICHDGQRYQLRVTAANKLILTK